MERGFHVMDHPDLLRPTDVVSQSGALTIAGRKLDAHIAKFAATEGDVWVFDPATKVAIVGDLVVDIVPFMDTACPDGWAKALDEVAATPFQTLIPGHGPVMDRADFMAWRTAYDNFVKCGHSAADAKSCVEGWERDAGKFIDAGHRQYAHDAAGYYLETRLRSSPAEQEKYCRPLKAS
jgi:glyoxylase-like metal-dependent hydrolase (beta-lactamase superfamily II)